MQHRKIVQPEYLNDQGFLFGGNLLKWVDEYAYITASLDYPGNRFVTISLDEVNFKHPVHPGEILLEEFLDPLGISQYRLAKDISVPPRCINEIVHGKRAISADTALRLARYFDTTDRFWLNLQTRYALEVDKDRLGDRLEREVQTFKKAG